MGTQTDMKPPEIPLHEIVAQGILLALVVVLGWRVIEYRNEQRAVTRLLEQKRQSETSDRGENAIDED
jgi:hypothetical protein